MLSVENITKKYGENIILNNLSFKIPQGEIVVLIGPSGSGKSTILRCINDLESYDSGKISINGLHQSKVGMVFQNFNLFNNMTLIDNLTYSPIKVLHKNIAEAKEIAIKWLNSVGLADLIDSYPRSLSGGQKQRAAIARALCMEPEIILFDEPTSALDPENVKSVFDVIKMLSNTGITMLIVTHAMKFAKDIADRVLFLDRGELVEETPASTFFSNPTSNRAKDFLNIIAQTC